VGPVGVGTVEVVVDDKVEVDESAVVLTMEVVFAAPELVGSVVPFVAVIEVGTLALDEDIVAFIPTEADDDAPELAGSVVEVGTLELDEDVVVFIPASREYRVNLFGPPQYSVLFPLHVMEQPLAFGSSPPAAL
jgi:hypothetical protein